MQSELTLSLSLSIRLCSIFSLFSLRLALCLATKASTISSEYSCMCMTTRVGPNTSLYSDLFVSVGLIIVTLAHLRWGSRSWTRKVFPTACFPTMTTQCMFGACCGSKRLYRCGSLFIAARRNFTKHCQERFMSSGEASP